MPELNPFPRSWIVQIGGKAYLMKPTGLEEFGDPAALETLVADAANLKDRAVLASVLAVGLPTIASLQALTGAIEGDRATVEEDGGLYEYQADDWVRLRDSDAKIAEDQAASISASAALIGTALQPGDAVADLAETVDAKIMTGAERTAIQRNSSELFVHHGRGVPTLPNLFVAGRGIAGYYVQSDGNLAANANFAATDAMPVVPGQNYVFSRRPEQLAFKDGSGDFIAGSYVAPTTGGVFVGNVSGNQLTITSTTAGALAVGTPITVRGAENPIVGLEVQSVDGGSVYTLNGSFPVPLTGVRVYGGYKVAAPANAASLQASMTNTQTLFGFATWGIYPGSQLPIARTGGGILDNATANRASILAARAEAKALLPQNAQLFDRSQATNGYYYANGGLNANAAYYATARIKVTPGAQYICDKASGAGHLQYWDELGDYAGQGTITANTAFTIPAGVYEIAFSGAGAGWLDLKLVAGNTVPAGRLPFLSPATLDTRVYAMESQDVAGRLNVNNLFNSAAAYLDYAIAPGGNRYTSGGTVGYFSADIAVIAGLDYFIGALNYWPENTILRAAWLASDGTTLISYTGNIALDAVYTAPAGAAILRFDLPNQRWLQSLMIAQTSTVPAGYRGYKQLGERPKQDASIILLGDSFTDRIGTAGGWVPYFLNKTGARILANHALAGRATRDALKTRAGVALVDADFDNATDVIIELGTNDYAGAGVGGRALGTIADAATGYAGAGSFYNDVFVVLNTIYGYRPDGVRISWATPTKRVNFDTANTNGFVLKDYANAINDVCSMFSTPVLDMFNIANFNAQTLGSMTGDGLHPNDTYGRPAYGRTLARLWNAV